MADVMQLRDRLRRALENAVLRVIHREPLPLATTDMLRALVTPHADEHSLGRDSALTINCDLFDWPQDIWTRRWNGPAGRVRAVADGLIFDYWFDGPAGEPLSPSGDYSFPIVAPGPAVSMGQAPRIAKPVPRMFVLGDSLDARSNDPVGTTNPGFAVHGRWTWVRTLAYGRLDFWQSNNYAIGGTTLHDVLTNPAMLPAVLGVAVPGDLVWVGSITNTIIAAGQPFDDSVKADYREIVRLCRNAGLHLILGVGRARNTWSNDNQRYSFTHQRRWLRQLGQNFAVRIADMWAMSEDPNGADPSSIRFGQSCDGLHQSTKGSLNDARYIMRIIDDWLPRFWFRPLTTFHIDVAPGAAAAPNLDPYAPLLDGGMLAGTAGTITPATTGTIVLQADPSPPAGYSGGLAIGFTGSYTGTAPLTGTVNFSKRTDPDGIAVQRIVFSGITGGGKREFFQILRVQTNVANLWKGGDTVYLSCDITVRGPARTVNAQIVYNDGAGGIRFADSHRSLPDLGVAVTLTGTMTAGNTLSVIITDPALSGSPISIAHIVVAGDTTTVVVADWAAQINAHATLQAAKYSATAAGNTLTIFATTDANWSAAFATTGTGSASVGAPPGQFGNLPNDGPISGSWTTPLLTLPPEAVPNASTLRQALQVVIDTTQNPPVDVIVDLRQMSLLPFVTDAA